MSNRVSILLQIAHVIAIMVSLGLACALAFKDSNQTTGVIRLYAKPIATRELSLLDPILSRLTEELPQITLPAEIQSAADKAAAAVTSAIENAKKTLTVELFGGLTLGTRHGCVQIHEETVCLQIEQISSIIIGSVALAGISLLLDIGRVLGLEWAVVPVVIGNLVLAIFSAVVVVYSTASHALFSAVAARLGLGVERGAAIEHAVAMLVVSTLALVLCISSLLTSLKADLKG